EDVHFTNYWNYNDSYFAMRVRYVVDPDGGTNIFRYLTNYAAHAWQVSEVRDRYGRKALMDYEESSSARLTSITDPATNSSAFDYLDDSGWITNLTTVYGSTGFRFHQVLDTNVTDGYSLRATYVTEPESAHQLFYYLHETNVLASNAIPPSVTGQTFDD